MPPALSLAAYQLAAEAVIGLSRGVLEGVERCFNFVFCHLREKHIERARGHRDPDNHEDKRAHDKTSVSRVARSPAKGGDAAHNFPIRI